MRGFIKRVAVAITNVAAIAMASGCQFSLADSGPDQPAARQVPGTASRQLIIKFKPNTIACSPSGIARLSASTHVKLEFVRPMSGDACVVKQLADNAGDFTQGQKTLKQNAAIEWIEQDAVMKAL